MRLIDTCTLHSISCPSYKPTVWHNNVRTHILQYAPLARKSLTRWCKDRLLALYKIGLVGTCCLCHPHIRRRLERHTVYRRGSVPVQLRTCIPCDRYCRRRSLYVKYTRIWRKLTDITVRNIKVDKKQQQ